MNTKTTERFLGDNLRLCRLISGLSLNELGEKVETTRQYIQQLEKDTKSPSLDLIKALAYELNVKTSFFYNPINNHIKEEECHFRKLKTTLVSARRECTARATLLNKLVDSIDNKLNLPKISFPNLKAESLLDAEAASMEARNIWGLGEGPIKNVIRVLENAGAIVATFGTISEKVDALSIHRNRPIILINQDKSSPRIRMDLAHECAHIILHDGIETGDKNTENQADYFASTFLLPRQSLLKEYGTIQRKNIDWKAIKSIKIKWGVSARSIIFRLHQLDIINPKQYRAANIHFSKTGQTKQEWYDNDIPRECPELLGSCIELLAKAYGSNIGGLLDELDMTTTFLSNITQQSLPEVFFQRESSSNVTDISKYF